MSQIKNQYWEEMMDDLFKERDNSQLQIELDELEFTVRGADNERKL